jgi:hypothetical protein
MTGTRYLMTLDMSSALVSRSGESRLPPPLQGECGERSCLERGQKERAPTFGSAPFTYGFVSSYFRSPFAIVCSCMLLVPS